MSRKTYFPIASFDYAPDKLIQIGQIISDPKSPTKPITRPLEPIPEIHHSYKDNWRKEKENTSSGSVGIWASYLAIILGLGGDLTSSFHNEDGGVLKFRRLDTYFIEPTDDYVKASMQAETVKEFFEQNPKKTPFMITGVKVARGAEAVTRSKRNIGAEAKIDLDATALTGAPISAGPKVALSKQVVDNESFTDSSDFVFAYRLRRIYIRRRKHDIYSEEFVKGALYTQGKGEVAKGNAPERVGDGATMMEFDVVGVDKEDFGREEEISDWSSVIARDEDGDEDCTLLCPFSEITY